MPRITFNPVSGPQPRGGGNPVTEGLSVLAQALVNIREANRQKAAQEEQKMRQGKIDRRQEMQDELANFQTRFNIDQKRAEAAGLAPGVQEYVGGDETPAPPLERFIKTQVPEQLGGGEVASRVTSPEERQALVAETNRKALLQRGIEKEQDASIEEKHRKPEKTTEFEDYLKSKYGDKPTADQRLSARRQWEAANDTAKAGGEGTWVEAVGPQGEPVLFNAKTNQTKAYPEGVQPKPTGRQSLTKEERQQFSSINFVLPRLDSFSTFVSSHPEFYGKFDAVKTALQQSVPGFVSGEYASKQAFIGRLNAEIRHALFGASLTEGEKESAKSFMIDEKDQPEVITSKIEAAKERMQSDINYYSNLGYKVTVPSKGGNRSGIRSITPVGQ